MDVRREMVPSLRSQPLEHRLSSLLRILALITGLVIVAVASWSIAVGWRRTADTPCSPLNHSEAS